MTDQFTPTEQAFRDWLTWQPRDAGCDIRYLSPEGMAEVTVRRFRDEGWSVTPPTDPRPERIR